MATRKKKSDLATVVTKVATKKAAKNVLDAQFTRTDPPEPTLPGLGDEIVNVRTGAVTTITEAPATDALPALGDLGEPAAEPKVIVGALTPEEKTIVRKDEPKAAKYQAFTHVQANVKGGIDVKLAPCTAIVGPNRSKKTAVLDAIKLAILGTHPSVADRPADLLAFASTGADNLTATISSPNGQLTTMMADEPGFKQPKHEAVGELSTLLAAVDARQIVPTVAINEILGYGETRMREAIFRRFGGGIAAKMPEGLSDEQQELWLSTEKLLRGSDGGPVTEPTYATLAAKFRELKLEAGRLVKRSEEAAKACRAELGEATLVTKEDAAKMHTELERLTREGAELARASRVNSEYQIDKENFVRMLAELGEMPADPGAEPEFGPPAGPAIDTDPLRKAHDAARALVEQDSTLLAGLTQIVAAAERTNTCPCCRASGGNTVADIRATHAAITKRLAARTQASGEAANALNAALHKNAQRTLVESPEHAAWAAARNAHTKWTKRREALLAVKTTLLAAKAALPPQPSLQQLADADQALNACREKLQQVTSQAGQVAVLESHEAEARRARNHNAAFKVLEAEATAALKRSLERVRADALTAVNRYVPEGWEVRLTLDDGACRWEIVGADGEAHGKGVASGSEWATLTIALACAWTEGSPLRVLLVDDDDLGKFSPASLKTFLDRLRAAVAEGLLTQVVIAWTRPEEIPAGWTQVQR